MVTRGSKKENVATRLKSMFFFVELPGVTYFHFKTVSISNNLSSHLQHGKDGDYLVRESRRVSGLRGF